MPIAMRLTCLLLLSSFAISAGAQDWSKMQPPLWSAKPDVAAFQNI